MATGRYTHLSRGVPLRLEYGNAIRQRPPCYFRVSCVSKSAMRVLEEVVSTRGTTGARLLVRRSRGLSRVAQMEVLEELLQRGQCELVLPVRHRPPFSIAFADSISLLLEFSTVFLSKQRDHRGINLGKHVDVRSGSTRS